MGAILTNIWLPALTRFAASQTVRPTWRGKLHDGGKRPPPPLGVVQLGIGCVAFLFP